MSNLIPKEENGGLICLTHQLRETAIAVCRKAGGKWYVAEDDGFSDEVDPFSNLDSLCCHVEKNKLFGPWASPGN